MIIFWKELILDSRTLEAVVIESVMTIMLYVSLFAMTGIRPMQMAISLALTDMMFMV